MKENKVTKKNYTENKNRYIYGLVFWCIFLLGTVELISGVCAGDAQRYIQSEKQKDMENTALACANQYNERLQEYMRMVEAIKYDLQDCEQLLNLDNIKAINMLNQIEGVHSAYLINTLGMAISNQGATVDMRENELVQSILKSGKSGFSAPVYGVDGDKAVIFIGQPIYNQNNVLKGASMISVKASMFSDIISKTMSVSVGNGVCMLIDEQGNVADSYNGRISELKQVTNLFEYLKDAKYQGKEGYTRLLNEIKIKKTNECDVEKNGNQYCVVYTPVRVVNGYVVMIYESHDAYEQINNIKRYTKYMMLGIFISFVFFVTVMVVVNLILDRRVQYKEKELEEKAEIDGLTTLYNKIATEKYIQDYLKNEGKNVRSMLFIIDVDNFKNINDTKGHAFGDVVLSAIGRGLGSEFRVTDIVGRIGGDEFIVFLKNIPNHEIEVKEAERLVEFFHELQPGDYVKTKVTASIGAAIYPDDAQNFEVLYKAADQAVYHSKKRGKDGYSFYREVMEEI